MSAAIHALDVRPASRFFKALGDEGRLRIVALLSHGELCVCHIEAALQLAQPTASRLLAVLRNAGVVETRRAGSWVHYRLAPQADEMCRSQLKGIAVAFGKHKTIRDDVERLLKTRGAISCR